jgi:hypothetical protein
LHGSITSVAIAVSVDRVRREGAKSREKREMRYFLRSVFKLKQEPSTRIRMRSYGKTIITKRSR